jgi:hypothetical protein
MAAAGDAEEPSVVFAFANSSSAENIAIGKEDNEWASTGHGQGRLGAHWKKSGGHLYIFFHDYNGEGNEKMRGIARVRGPSDSRTPARWVGGTYGSRWTIEWLTKESFDSKPFAHLRDMDLVPSSLAIQMLRKMAPHDSAVRSLSAAAAAQEGQRTITSFFT